MGLVNTNERLATGSGYIEISTSAGDVMDRCAILEIKARNIRMEESLAHIRNERRLLLEAWQHAGLPEMKGCDEWEPLMAVNGALWEVEDALRVLESKKDFSRLFIQLARSVYRLNDSRAKLKRALNERLGAAIFEVKSYSTDAARPTPLAISAVGESLDGERAAPLTSRGDALIRDIESSLSRDGYALMPATSFLNQSTIDALDADCARLSDDLDDGNEPGVVRIRAFVHSRHARALALHPNVLQLLRGFFPNGPRLDLMLYREPLHGFGQQLLHRDAPPSGVAFFLNFAPTTRQNGAMRLIPGSHRESSASIQHAPIWIESEVPSLTVVNLSTLHGGSRNISGAPRRLLFLSYADMYAVDRGGSVFRDESEEARLDHLESRARHIAQGVTWASIEQLDLRDIEGELGDV